MTIENVIQDSLKSICKVCQADHSYLCLLSDKDRGEGVAWKYCHNEVKPSPLQKKISCKGVFLPEFCIRAHRCEALSAPDVNKWVGKTNIDARAVEKRQVRSFLCSPIIENDFSGCVALDTVKEKKSWDSGHWSLVHSIAEFLSYTSSCERAKKRVEGLAYHDPLTGLYNRAFFEAELKRLNVKRQHPLSVIMADVNGLKSVNDLSGHDVGDKLLRKAAKILNLSCRQEDIAVRWGGDEFFLLLPHTDQKNAKKICRRIKQKCYETRNDITPTVSMAVGYAVKENCSRKFAEVFHQAEKGMYKDKRRTGRRRNPVFLGTPFIRDINNT